VFVVTSAVPSALLAASLIRVPTIVYVGELFDRGFVGGGARRAGLALLRLFTACAADGVIACSRAVERQFAGERARLHLRTIYPGVPEELGLPAVAAARSRLGVVGGPCIAVLGNIGEARGQDTLVRALPAIRERFPDVRCVIAGATLPRAPDVRFTAYLRRLVSALELDNVVIFSGFVEAVEDVYAACDLVVNPARVNEALGRVALEALASGRPVVATRVGAVDEVLRDGIDAVLVPADDPATLAAAAVRLLDDPTLASRLVASGRARVRADFAEARGRDEFLAFVRHVTATR
jgi:glycosyltransferase involved in cell wall biosynthesis